MARRNMPKQTYTLKFVEKGTDRPCMPALVTTPTGTIVGSTGSYNSFDSKDDVNRYISAQRTLAKHFGCAARFDEHLGRFELVKEVAYTTKISL